MKKMRNNLLMFFCIVFLCNFSSNSFGQGKEWQRIRANGQEKEWQRIRQGTIGDAADQIKGGDNIYPEYYIASGDKILISIWKNPDFRKEPGSSDEEYFISVGDNISLSVWRSDPKKEEDTGIKKHNYLIAEGDIIRVFVWQHVDLSRDITVGPDGNISYPFVGRFKASGLTIEEVENKITKGLSKYIKYPEVSVMMAKFSEEEKVIIEKDLTVGPDGNISTPLIGTIKAAGLSISQLSKKIKSKLPRYIKHPEVSISIKDFSLGQESGILMEKSVTVMPDGTVSCPLIGRVDAAGFSLQELEEEIGSKIPPYITNAKASITMEEFSGKKIIVLGEVNYPGIYTYTGKIDLIEIAALAGDFTDDAREDSVMVVRGNLTEEPEVIRVDMKSAITKGTSDTDILLEPNDVVYVPSSFISNFNQFLDNITPSVDQATNILDLRREIRRLQQHSR